LGAITRLRYVISGKHADAREVVLGVVWNVLSGLSFDKDDYKARHSKTLEASQNINPEALRKEADMMLLHIRTTDF